MGVAVRAAERVGYRTRWTVEKWRRSADHAAGRAPDLVEHVDGNLLLNEGINELLTLLIGGSATTYSNANAQLGVGTSATSAQATDTDLLGTAVWKAMDSTYPQVAGSVVTFKSTYGSSDANQAWNEFSVRNGATANKNLNRKVEAKGTKASGETWVLTLTVTLS
jgi:hypothetical protein